MHSHDILRTKYHVPFSLHQNISPGLRLFRNTIRFYDEELLAPRLNPKIEQHPLSAVRDTLFNIFATTLRIGSMFPSAISGRGMSWKHD